MSTVKATTFDKCYLRVRQQYQLEGITLRIKQREAQQIILTRRHRVLLSGNFRTKKPDLIRLRNQTIKVDPNVVRNRRNYPQSTEPPNGNSEPPVDLRDTQRIPSAWESIKTPASSSQASSSQPRRARPSATPTPLTSSRSSRTSKYNRLEEQVRQLATALALERDQRQQQQRAQAEFEVAQQQFRSKRISQPFPSQQQFAYQLPLQPTYHQPIYQQQQPRQQPIYQQQPQQQQQQQQQPLQWVYQP
ncbi:uncharacterized protein LY79DRAFT_660536 [Colletotrichum navitas]|uniref:Uncharacterized protein n=1 Tax=Colletotrichum navitas TaxID=681940 RepID=A0AAD8V1L9_9PEZI|nr:uncharacterized protein LY79DRAFT_660536 [Colletotrichum navitas]KAK1585486.1 hypothetical protein LY79DRAFT_660536 [Colletotrichum navitas]